MQTATILTIIQRWPNGTLLAGMYLNGEVILQVDSVKYLGHHLTNDLHDDLDVRRQCRAINVRGNILFRKFHMCRRGRASLSVKLKLFNSYCARRLVRNSIPYTINNLPKQVVSKIRTHSLTGFTAYTKHFLIQSYQENCTLLNCYVCSK